VPGKDWVDDAAAVIVRIEAMLADGKDRALEQELSATRSAPLPVAAPAMVSDVTAEAAPPDVAAPAAQVRSLRFEQGASRKFWTAAVEGAALRVTYGRIGSAGQTLVKQFDSLERALREQTKLTDEKLRKGYLEV
jgi:predicted DNA-binding WGR domain protein